MYHLTPPPPRIHPPFEDVIRLKHDTITRDQNTLRKQFSRAQLRAFHTDEASLTVATTPRTKSQHIAASDEVSRATRLLSTSEDIANNFCFNSPDVDRRDTSVSRSTHPSHRPLTSTSSRSMAVLLRMAIFTAVKALAGPSRASSIARLTLCR